MIKTYGLTNVVLVHGAFADGSSWNKVIPLLLPKGLEVTAVQNPLSSLADDVAAVKRVLDMQPGPVLLVGHSWGGAVITEVGNDPRVAGLLYVAAAAPDNGQSLTDWGKNYAPPSGTAQIQPFGKDGFVALTPKGIFFDFAPDLTSAEKSLLLAAQGPTGGQCFVDRISIAAWRNKPSWFIVADEDRMLPPAAQRDSARRMNATTLTLPSSHVAMLSHPQQVADFIVKAAAGIDIPMPALDRNPGLAMPYAQLPLLDSGGSMYP